MRFSHDRRGQSVVIGTVILFGFLILALSLYQVQVVPQQNAQTEFEHFEEVRNDLVDLRAGILQAGSIDRPQYQTVRLGTSYSTRIFAINPPDPPGTIRTSRSYNITIEPESGDPVNVSTRFIQYRPGYNEIDPSSTWYDASVLYLDARDRGDGLVVIEDQTLVDNGEVQIVALQNEFRRSGTGQVTLEIRPAENITQTLPEGNLNVTVPTRLSEDDWKNKTDLPTDSDIYRGVTDDANNDGVYNLTLNTTADNLTVDTVGVGEAPEEPRQNNAGTPTDGDDGGSSLSPGFLTVEASDLPRGDARSDQTLSFIVNSTLPSDESVLIDLSAAQQGDFNYDDSSVNLVSGSQNTGTAQFTARDSNAVIIRYTANQDISAGEQIQLEVTSVNYNSGNRGEYSVTFSRSDGGSATDTFSDSSPGGGPGNSGNNPGSGGGPGNSGNNPGSGG